MTATFNWICILIFILAIFIICAGQSRSSIRDAFVQAMEMQMQVHPGERRVWPACQCSVQYVGTTVKGKRYFIEVDKLD